MGKRWVNGLLSRLFILLILIGVGIAAWWNWANQPYSQEGSEPAAVQLMITPGMTAAQIAQDLEQEQLIRHALTFRLLASLQNADAKLLAGEYQVSADMTPQALLDKLLEGPVVHTVKVTIPEGYTTAQIIDTLVSKGLGTKEEYKKVIENEPFEYSFLADIPTGGARLDGFLFPDTYFFDPEARPKDNINRMLKRFEQEVTPEVMTKLAEMNLSIQDWVNLASIVEKEAGKDADRPIIAGIFLNRLEIDMALQSCATIQYVLGTQKYVLSLEDIQIESPYNTYKYPGLPPSPIASPGHASLDAVLNSTESEYLYFLATPSGETIYAKTHQEHLQNQAKYMN
ncbi:endolytic transglycosylase MltG [Desulfitobacterium sp. THU1]|uniref:endolytic transglycosylase MltG n=1 Tax=Desulfitobacterium sp. THU1 TaxID=3138072 RepID=UPI00311DB366